VLFRSDPVVPWDCHSKEAMEIRKARWLLLAKATLAIKTPPGKIRRVDNPYKFI